MDSPEYTDISWLKGNQMIESQPIMRRVRGGYSQFNSEESIILMSIFCKKKKYSGLF